MSCSYNLDAWCIQYVNQKSASETEITTAPVALLLFQMHSARFSRRSRRRSSCVKLSLKYESMRILLIQQSIFRIPFPCFFFFRCSLFSPRRLHCWQLPISTESMCFSRFQDPNPGCDVTVCLNPMLFKCSESCFLYWGHRERREQRVKSGMFESI